MTASIFHIPVPRVTAVADTDEQLDLAEYATFVGPLFEGDLLSPLVPNHSPPVHFLSGPGSDLLAIAAFSANADISKRRNILTPQFTLYRNPQRNV
jgi:hypothetical protein